MDYPIPSKEEIEEWIKSEEGQRIYDTLHNIDAARHLGFSAERLGLHYGEDVAEKSPEECYEWVKEQLPIEEIYHAAYIPKIDLFIFSDEDEWVLGRSCLDDKLKEIGVFDYNYHYTIGTVATIKSNRWRVFDTLYVYKSPGLGDEDLQLGRKGIAEGGYILLWRDIKREKYVPVLPD